MGRVDYLLQDEDEDTIQLAYDFLREFIKYDECITIVFDTETRTATVQKIK